MCTYRIFRNSCTQRGSRSHNLPVSSIGKDKLVHRVLNVLRLGANITSCKVHIQSCPGRTPKRYLAIKARVPPHHIFHEHPYILGTSRDGGIRTLYCEYHDVTYTK